MADIQSRVRRRTDAWILMLVFGLPAIWGGFFFARYVRAGGHPFFYQAYYEPAVMVACGKGFFIADHQPPALAAFLNEQTDRFSCDQLPANLAVGTNHMYQQAWRYLLMMVGVTWRLVGISWSGLAPLYGVLFGITTALAYSICRLIVGRIPAACCAMALSVSTLQLTNLPNLRDYAKAPFTLALILILVTLVVRPLRPRTILLLALAYGLVMGIGYGFRTDLLIDIPPFLITLALFLPGGWGSHWRAKIAAVGLFAAAFAAAGWPIITSIVGRGGCQWHVFLLGLTNPFTDALGVRGGSYDWGHLYRDEFMWTTVSSYATRLRPDLGYIEYCSREYDVASWEYLRHILVNFPADMVTRAYAAVLHILNLPFRRFDALAGNSLFLYTGACLAVVFVLAISRSSLRLALFAVFVILYFGGYPAVQFLPRHYFLFEFIGWVILAFLVEGAVSWVAGIARLTGVPSTDFTKPMPGIGGVRRIVTCAVLVFVLIAVPLVTLRTYQSRRVTGLLESYVAAPRESAPYLRIGSSQNPRSFRTTPERRPGVSPTEPGHPVTRFVEAALDASACRVGTTVTFRYDPGRPPLDFSRSVLLVHEPKSGGLTRIFEATFDGFQGVDVSDDSPGCLQDVAVVTSAERLPLLLFAELTPGWKSQPQYQRILARTEQAH